MVANFVARSRRARSMVWVLILLCAVFTFTEVTAFAQWAGIGVCAFLLDPILTFAIVLFSYLEVSLDGGSKWITVGKWAAGVMTLTANIALPLLRLDGPQMWGSLILHSFIPVIMFIAVEAVSGMARKGKLNVVPPEPESVPDTEPGQIGQQIGQLIPAPRQIPSVADLHTMMLTPGHDLECVGGPPSAHWLRGRLKIGSTRAARLATELVEHNAKVHEAGAVPGVRCWQVNENRASPQG